MRLLRFPFPPSPPPYPSACQRVQELSHFLRREEYVVGGRSSPGDLRVVGRADEDAYPALREGFEGVLVGDVVAQVEGHHVVAVEIQGLEQIEHGSPLVPFYFGLYFVDHLAGRNPKLLRVLGKNGIDDLPHSRTLLIGDQPVVRRNRGSLDLDQGTLDGIELLVEPPLYPVEQRLELGALLALYGTLRAPDVEAVATGDDQVVEAHELLHHPPVAPADHAHRTPTGELADSPAHALGDDGVFGPVHYRRQGAVIVEEYSGTPHIQQPGQLVTVGQRVRQITDVLGHYPLLVSY